MSVAVAAGDETRSHPELSLLPSSDDELQIQRDREHRPEPGIRRVLVTDDNAGLRETLTEILSNEGYAVETAPNGRVAMAVLESRPVDVLLLDLNMPLMDGIALLREIEPPPPVVIIYSAFAFYNPDEVRLQVGAKVFKLLRKPLPPSQLVAAIGDAIAELGSE